MSREGNHWDERNVAYALQRTAASRRSCNRRVSWLPSLSLGSLDGARSEGVNAMKRGSPGTWVAANAVGLCIGFLTVLQTGFLIQFGLQTELHWTPQALGRGVSIFARLVGLVLGGALFGGAQILVLRSYSIRVIPWVLSTSARVRPRGLSYLAALGGRPVGPDSRSDRANHHHSRWWHARRRPPAAPAPPVRLFGLKVAQPLDCRAHRQHCPNSSRIHAPRRGPSSIPQWRFRSGSAG